MSLDSEVASIVSMVAPGAVYKPLPPAGADELPAAAPETKLLARDKQRPLLFDYQKELVEAGARLVREGQKGLISLPTGAGKTRTAVYLLLDQFLTRPKLKALWLAPTIELLDQAQSTFESLWLGFGSVGDVRIYRNSRVPLSDEGSIVFLTPQALFGVKTKALLSNWDVLVFDEAHQMSAPKFLESVEKVVSHSPSVAVVGLSATPGRMADGETEALSSIFDANLLTSKVLGSKPVQVLQNRGILSRLQFHNLGDTAASNETARRRTAIEKLLELSKRNAKVLVFATSIAESLAVASLLRERGAAAAHIDGETPEAERRHLLQLFSSGNIEILLNQKLLTTGYDCPAVTDVMIMGRVGSPIVFEQMVGRAARGPRTGGTSIANVWQFYDHLDIHGLPSSYYRYKDEGWNIVQK